MAGLGAGLAAVGIVSLFTRNADNSHPNGTQVEMVLQRPVLLEEQELSRRRTTRLRSRLCTFRESAPAY